MLGGERAQLRRLLRRVDGLAAASSRQHLASLSGNKRPALDSARMMT